MSDTTDEQPQRLSNTQPKDASHDHGFQWFSYIAVGIAIVSLFVAVLVLVGAVWLLIRWLA